MGEGWSSANGKKDAKGSILRMSKGTSPAQEPPTRLNRHVTRVVKSFVEDFQVPGAAVCVLERGLKEPLCFASSGDCGDGSPFSLDTLFHLHSLTKTVVSIATMILVERGEVALSQPVYQILGDSWKKEALRVLVGTEYTSCEEEITVKQLLTHTSGLSYGREDTEVDKQYKTSLEESQKKQEDLAARVDRLAKLPLSFQPGTRFQYSYSTDVLGRVLEVVSGLPLDRFLEREIFFPLGMGDTKFYVPETDSNRYAKLHSVDDEGQLIHSSHGGHARAPTSQPVLLNPGGGLVSSLRDVCKLFQCLIDNGRRGSLPLLSYNSLRLMCANRLPGNQSIGECSIGPSPFKNNGFGFGFCVELDGCHANTLSSPGSVYWVSLGGSFIQMDLTSGVAIVFAMQVTMHPLVLQFREKLANAVFSAL